LAVASCDVNRARRATSEALRAACGRIDTTPPGGVALGKTMGGYCVCSERESRNTSTASKSDRCATHSP